MDSQYRCLEERHAISQLAPLTTQQLHSALEGLRETHYSSQAIPIQIEPQLVYHTDFVKAIPSHRGHLVRKMHPGVPQATYLLLQSESNLVLKWPIFWTHSLHLPNIQIEFIGPNSVHHCIQALVQVRTAFSDPDVMEEIERCVISVWVTLCSGPRMTTTNGLMQKLNSTGYKIVHRG